MKQPNEKNNAPNGKTTQTAEETPLKENQPKEQHKRTFFEHILQRSIFVSSRNSRPRKKLMKKFRKAKNVPSESEVERFVPDLDEGLSEEQVDLRFNQFLFNDVTKKYSKSYRSILIDNICTFFNLLCLIVAVALAIAGASLSQFIFVLVFAINLVIGIVQEILAKKQIDKLSLLVSSTAKVIRGGTRTEIPVNEIVLDDVIFLETGQQVPADCILADGNVEVNESLLTGESESLKKAEGDMLYAGSFITSGACRVRAEKVGKASYLNNLTAKAKEYKRPHSEIMNSIRLFIRAIGTIILPVAALVFYSNWKGVAAGADDIELWEQISESIQYTGAVIVGMIPSGLLLLTSLAMAMGMRRLSKKQTLVQDMYSLEMLARVNVLCLDKTGTLTDGRMAVSDCMVVNTFEDYTVDEIMGNMLMALDDNNQTSIALQNKFGHSSTMRAAEILPFSSKRKLSAVTFEKVGTFAFGAPEFILRPMPARINRITKQYAQMGMRVLALAHSPDKIENGTLPANFQAIALITLVDNIRPEAVETIKWFRENDVDIRIISGDNPVTVSEVARRVGVKDANKYISLDGLTDIEIENIARDYTVFGRVTPEQKAILIKTLKRDGNTVAMTGDGVNDILALKEADCAISIASGSEAARNISHLVLVNNNFMNLPSVVEEGRRVINNIKNTASLYIMKTLFTTMLALICVLIPGQEYFFKSNNLILFEFFVAAVPSFIISMQPNNERVKGKFIPYVLARSIPGAITLILCVLAVYFGNLYLPDESVILTVDTAGNILSQTTETTIGFGTNFKPMLILAVTFGGIVMLYRILQPMNVLRTAIFFGSLGICIVFLSVPVLGNIIYDGWGDVVFTVMQGLYIVCIMLAAFPVSGWLIKAFDLLNPD